ncbi:MAG TPA: PLP-dependent aminotransferase family protein [Gemmatimonadaceae bacterium]
MRTAASPQLLALLPIDRTARVPLHRQVYDGLRRAILEGQLRPGQRVPSTRELASDLGVSRLPVLTAYEQLRHEGYIDGRIGSGTYISAALPDDALRPVRVAASAPRSMSVPSRSTPTWPARSRASSSSRAAVQRRVSLRAVPRPRNDGGLRPFRVSLPALDAFPHALWARLVARHAHRLPLMHMAYGDPAGVGVLRAAIAEHLRGARGVRCEAEQVLITSGSQAALRLCAAVLVARGDRVAVEEPGYLGARVALRTAGAELVPVPVDDEGIDVTVLGAWSRRRRPSVRAVYVTPSHQYPLGIAMSAARRLALLEWAVRHEAWVLEDDYDSEYRYVSRPLAALQGMDVHERVIYIGTFSKVLFPALRVGYLVVPSALRDRFVEAREALDLFSPTLYQLALADFLRDGHFARHLRRMRAVYLRRREALLNGLARHCDALLTVLNADAGLHVSTLLRDDIDDTRVVARMASRGLTATALSPCYATRVRRSGLLLGFGGSDERAIAGATRVLRDVLRES